MKFFQKLLVAPATAAMLIVPSLNGFAEETAADAKSRNTLKISVTGTRSPRETKNVPASVTVIDKNEIDSRGITDFRDLFKYEPGVSIKSDDWRYTNSKGQNNINIRGMEDDRVLLLRDI